ncbi:hypothetical protein HDU86_006697 [Geranomyces michiganensis]|nr:hypothetical protein HDU86_006697 [Geranomyces michiganensis]
MSDIDEMAHQPFHLRKDPPDTWVIDFDLWLYALQLSREVLTKLPAEGKTAEVLKALKCDNLLLAVLGITPRGSESPRQNSSLYQDENVSHVPTSGDDKASVNDSEEDETDTHTMVNPRKRRRLSYRLQLSDEILENIFENIEAADLITVALVNRQWCETALRLLWIHPHLELPSSDLQLFKFYACTESRNALRVRRLTICYRKPDDDPMTDALLLSLPGFLPALMSVELFSTWIPDGMLVRLGQACPRLTELEMRRVNGLEPQELIAFFMGAGARLTRLHIGEPGHVLELAVSNREFKPVVAAFAVCTALRKLSLPWMRLGEAHFKRLFAVLPGCLEAIDVSNTRVDDSCLEVLLDRCAGLTTVILSRCAHITDESIKLLATKCDDLTNVAIGETLTSDAGIRVLARSCGTNLRRLSIHGCSRVSDLVLGVLGLRCPNITLLDVSGCSRINASGVISFLKSATTPITLQAKTPRLRHLNLSICNASFTSSAVCQIIDLCPDLRTLLLPATRLAKAREHFAQRCKDPEAMYMAFFPSVWLRPAHRMRCFDGYEGWSEWEGMVGTIAGVHRWPEHVGARNNDNKSFEYDVVPIYPLALNPAINFSAALHSVALHGGF